MNYKIETYSAVSPVVGVMLMLVVTIIIAAVVSGFAGSMGDVGTKTPQATISGHYSYSDGIFSMTHEGGDQLSTQKLIIQLRQNDEDFGGYGSLFKGLAKVIDKVDIVDSDGVPWIDESTGQSSVSVFRPGDTYYYNKTLSFETGDQHSTFTADKMVGRSLILTFTTTDGKLISQDKVIIEP